MKTIFKSIVVRALTWEARLLIRRRKPSVVAVTGSVGKTSTKDAIYAALCDSAHVRKSEKSFNSELGVPLTILGRPNAWNNPLRWAENIIDGLLISFFRTAYPDWLVLEVGADRPGDIRSVAAWLPMDIAVITRLPEVPVHVEYFDTPEALLEEKASLIMGLKPSGTLILSADDPRVAALAKRAAGRRVITFGFSPEATVRGMSPDFLQDELGRVTGMRARAEYNGSRVELFLRGAVGTHVFMPALAALAAAVSLDMPLEEAAAALARNRTPTLGRMHLVTGMHGSVLIDDTYNSSPAALEAALETLKTMPATGKKIAVLGDMMELGRFSVEEHRSMGALAVACADRLITVGIRARDIAGAALDAGMAEDHILQCDDAEAAGGELAHWLAEGDVTLLKGSQSVRLERAAAMVMAEPSRAKEVLVRQESEWKKR